MFDRCSRRVALACAVMAIRPANDSLTSDVATTPRSPTIADCFAGSSRNRVWHWCLHCWSSRASPNGTCCWGRLHGGMLLPAPRRRSDLWHTYTASWHDTGFGSTTDAPPYLAIVAMVGAVLLGSAQLAVKVLLLGSVPIAGLTAYIAARPIVATNRLRVWLSATYALLPVATGSIASGRLGTAVAFAVLPLVLLLVGHSLLPPLYTHARRSVNGTSGRTPRGRRASRPGRPHSCSHSAPRSTRCCTCCCFRSRLALIRRSSSPVVGRHAPGAHRARGAARVADALVGAVVAPPGVARARCRPTSCCAASSDGCRPSTCCCCTRAVRRCHRSGSMPSSCSLRSRACCS